MSAEGETWGFYIVQSDITDGIIPVTCAINDQHSSM